MTARPVRLQLSRRKGFDLQALSRETNGLPAVNCARPSKWGNPFPVDAYGQEGAVDRFRRLLAGQMSTLEMSESSRCDRWSLVPGASLVMVRQDILRDLPELRGKNLACWCRLGQPCHCDVLLDTANRPLVCEEVTP